ncbi:MAG: serine hydrolase domain-containing protein [Acidobacteriaceae bacterium]
MTVGMLISRKARYVAIAGLLISWASAPLRTLAQNSLPSDQQAKVDAIAQQVLATTGVPSASVGIVTNGKIAYVKAYGKAQLDPPVEATPEMRYSIGSISKQFTATAILMLQQQGKLKLDDPISTWLPQLTRSKEVTLREILSPHIRLSGLLRRRLLHAADEESDNGGCHLG